MDDLMNVERPLKSCFAPAIGAGAAPKGAVTSAQGGVLCFDTLLFYRVGVDVDRIQVLRGLRMFPMRGFLFGTFSPRPGLLRLLVFQPHFHTLGQHLRRATALTFPPGLGAQREEHVAITAFAVGKKTHIVALLEISDQGLHHRLEQLRIFRTTALFYDEAASPLHHRGCPALGLARLTPFSNNRVEFVAFEGQADKLMTNRVNIKGAFCSAKHVSQSLTVFLPMPNTRAVARRPSSSLRTRSALATLLSGDLICSIGVP